MSEQLIIDAMADCVLPEEIMFCILTRLPVKSLVRFRSVCKPWRELFAHPQFIKMHYHQSSSCPKNQTLIINHVFGCKRTTSDLSIESDVSETAKLDPRHHVPFQLCSSFRPYPSMFCVGCCDGVVCMSILSKSHLGKVGIVFWNPALRLSKFVRIPQANISIFYHVISLGYGYDNDGDLRVVKIVSLRQNDYFVSEVGVYSAKSDTWTLIELNFGFRLLSITNHGLLVNKTTVNGNPYWVGRIGESDALICCDMTRLEFKTVPLSDLELEDATKVPFVNWRGSLAALLHTTSDERLESLDVWVFQDCDMVWTKNHSFGPVEIRCLQCSENGLIMGQCLDGKLFVLDPETRWVKEIDIDEYRNNYLKVHGYNESLVCVEGMKQIEMEDWKSP